MTSDVCLQTSLEPLELYFHIPFCVQKCAYCDFLSAPAKREVQEAYMDCLLADLEQRTGKDEYEVQTIFFGGGTPTVVNPSLLVKVLSACRTSFRLSENAEITIEANPGTITPESLLIYRRAGINRISFGLQSTHKRELALLGRIHSYEDFLESFRLARNAGFSNINVDLMMALPGQTRESYQQSLNRLAELGPEHISAYSLMIEEGTPFFSAYQEDVRKRERGGEPRLLPSEELEEQMYEDTARILGQYGYKQYEISNYAKDGFLCRHNDGYWTGVSYAGFGLGAASYLKGCRFRKTRNLESYLKGDFAEREKELLSKKDQMAEFMILGLRRTKGISVGAFEERFHESFPKRYKEIAERFQGEGLIAIREGRIYFTRKGIFLSNQVLLEFLG